MNSNQYNFQQITVASQVDIINNVQNEQRIDQEGDNSITNDNARPLYSYISLIGQAILTSTDKKCQLYEIRRWITNKYPFYKMENKGWQRGKGFWAIPDEYQACFVNGVYNNNKAKEIKASEENASFSGCGEAINSSSNETVEIQRSEIPELTPSSQELATQFSPHSTIRGSIHRPTSQRSEITYNTIMRYIHEISYFNATEASNSSLSAPYDYVNMAEVEIIKTEF
ncbi:789_t:CDS:2 [Diversispora eburnea]|uniref:789_t:CDS:1 n=1 Tax=Diversispora eburnea TaxID=1213867 RepID=A0A9N8ZN67_9GLOM|nr:789_t:CDS:2 [Diversispora eburnea]